MKIVSCGCCSGGCVCFNHQDIPRGVKPGKCEIHKKCPTGYEWAAHLNKDCNCGKGRLP